MIDENYQVNYNLMLINKQANKYGTLFKETYQIFQTYNNRKVKLKM